jgi:hypothetical protein
MLMLWYAESRGLLDPVYLTRIAYRFAASPFPDVETRM